jgi:adenosylcobyric acid synthase
VFGVCAGFQILGRTITDDEGVDGPSGRAEGLGYLDIDTTLSGDKTLRQVTGIHQTLGEKFEGFEMHVGETSGPDCDRPLVNLEGRMDGSISPGGQISGCYVHGIFASDTFRHAFLKRFNNEFTQFTAYWTTVDQALDALADRMEVCLDLDHILRIAIAGAD